MSKSYKDSKKDLIPFLIFISISFKSLYEKISQTMLM